MKKKFIALLCVICLCITNVMPAFASEDVQTSKDVTINSVTFGKIIKGDMSAMTDGGAFTVKINANVPATSSFSGFQLDYARFEDGDMMSSQEKYTDSYGEDVVVTENGEERTYEIPVYIDEYDKQGEYKVQQIWVYYGGNEREEYVRNGDKLECGNKSVSYDSSAEFSIPQNENEDNEDPALISFKRVSPDDDATIYTNTDIKFEIEYADAGVSGVKSITVAFEKEDGSEQLFFGEVDKAGQTSGVVQTTPAYEVKPAGKYKLSTIGVIDYAGNQHWYDFTYDENGVMSSSENISGGVSGYEFVIEEGTEDKEENINSSSVLVDSISVVDNKVTFEETVAVKLCLYNPTDNKIVVTPENWGIMWSYYNQDYEDTFLTSDCWAEEDPFVLAAGEKRVITLYHFIYPEDSDGARTLWGITGEGIQYVINEEGNLAETDCDSSEAHTLLYTGTADFTVGSVEDAAEIMDVSLNATEIVSGEFIPGRIILKDKINTSYLLLCFNSLDTEYTWYMYADAYDLNMQDDEFTYQFEAKTDTYVLPGKYQLDSIWYAKDEAGDNVGYYECLSKDIFVKVNEPEGMAIIDNGKLVDESSAVLNDVESGETVVITDMLGTYYTVPAEFLELAKDKDIKVVFASAEDAGEMILDPDNKMESYEDFEFQFEVSELNIIEDEDEWMAETAVEAYTYIGVQMGQADIPITIRVKQELLDGVSYYLFAYNEEDKKFVLVDKNLEPNEEGYIEIDFPNGIGGTNARSLENVQKLEYYLGVKTTTDECTEHISDNKYTVVEESNCFEAGYESQHCIYCDAIINGTERELPLVDHTWDDGVVTTPSTCSTEGVREHKCTLEGCGAVKEEAEPVDDKNHTYSWKYRIVEMATCTEGAVLKICCSECEKEHPALGCEEEGCSAEHPELLEIHTWPLGHIHDKKVVTKATTKANGKIEYVCSRSGCKDVDDTKTVPIYKPSKMTLSTATYTYDGKTKKPSVTITDSKGKKISSSNYSISYPSGRKNVGKYTVKVTFKGNYSGTMSASFVINPKKTSMSSVSKASKAFTAKWKKQSTQVTGYQIQYSTSKSFKSAKTVTVSSYKTTSKKVTKLKAKTTYYVRVRTYKTVGKTKFYSGWSSAKSVKTK